ncbi:hypothetical protein ACVW0P_002613 [Mucilaginibacter sp. UYNi724]
MKNQLMRQLHSYLLQNYTDLLIALQEEHRLEPYLKQKVASVADLLMQLQEDKRPLYVIEALCMEELTRDLRPSRFNYMRELLETEFEKDFKRMSDSGILTYELINLIGACEPIFEVFAFGEETEDSDQLKHAVMGMIAEYLER